MASRSTQSRRITVALDGPASSGKSSVGAAAAEQLQLRFVDTGLFYRALTALALREGIPTDDARRLVPLIDRVSLHDDGTGKLTRVLLDGEDATAESRTAAVDANVSAVARVPEVREALLDRQRDLAATGGIVVAGRDIGTVVLPDADLKLFLDASVDERAQRRIEERGLDPQGDEAEEVREQLRARDAIDTGREVAPLRAADDALHIRTDGNRFEDTVEIVAAEIARVMLTPPAPSRGRRTARDSRTAPAAAAAGDAMRPAATGARRAGTPPAVESPAATAEAGFAAAELEAAREAAREAELQGPFEPAEGTTKAEPSRDGRSSSPGRPVRRAINRAKPTLLEVAMRLDNNQSMLVRMVALVSRIGARAFADVKVEGLEHIPRTGAVILAGNHISNADAVIAGAWITDALKRRRIHWLGKKEIFDWPVFGWIAAHGGIHPVDRDAADVDAFRLATRILEKGHVLLVFPEGTRSPTASLQEAKDGAAMLALRSRAQVVPMGISNTDAVWKKGQKLPRPFPRRTVTLRIGPAFRVQDVVPEGTDRRTAKRLATTLIMGRIAALLDPRHRGVYADAIREAVNPEP